MAPGSNARYARRIMAIRIPNVAEIRATFGTTLKSDLFGDPEIASRVEMTKTMFAIRAWAQQSKTAREIIKHVEEADQEIIIVGMKKGGYTCFSSDDPVVGKGVVYFDFDARFATKQAKDTQAAMHHYIAFLHELGHAKQWIESPVFFNGSSLNTKKFATDLAAAAKTFWQKKQKITYGQAGALLQHNNMRLTNPSWAVRIEMDNLTRHEWPICDETRTPRRLGYTDLIMT